MPLWIIVGTREAGKTTVVQFINMTWDLGGPNITWYTMGREKTQGFQRLVACAQECQDTKKNEIIEMPYPSARSDDEVARMFSTLAAAGAWVIWVDWQRRQLDQPNYRAYGDEAEWHKKVLGLVKPRHVLDNNSDKRNLFERILQLWDTEQVDRLLDTSDDDGDAEADSDNAETLVH